MSIVKLDRHNNGGFSSGEQAQGNPYHPGAIETCCTIAWMAMSVEMLRMTGDPLVADELELSTLNQVVGSYSPTGRWSTYNTPMDGRRVPSTQDIAFQIRPGSEELNCCSVNAARGFGLLSDWAVMCDGVGLTVNWYGPSTIETEVNGKHVTLRQDTAYPRDGKITLHVEPDSSRVFALRLRIPHWSRASRVAVNGEQLSVQPGTYATIERTWHTGDVVTIELDMAPRYWSGERECAGKASIYRGPLLLVYEAPSAGSPPALRVADLAASRLVESAPGAIIMIQLHDAAQRVVKLRDFGTAGQGGDYVSWLPIEGAPSTAFSRQNPGRTSRAD